MAEASVKVSGSVWVTCSHIDSALNWRISKDGIGYSKGQSQDPFILQIGEEDNSDARMLLLCEFCSARVEIVVIKELVAHVVKRLLQSSDVEPRLKLSQIDNFLKSVLSTFVEREGGANGTTIHN